MRRYWLVLLSVLAACNGNPAEQTVAKPAYNIDATRISTSGLSAGAYMAAQFHIAHSDIVRGAALLAGGPYWCAQASLTTALGACVSGGDLALPALTEYAQQQASAGTIDKLENLADDRVWVFHGAKDDVVSAEVSVAAAAMYRALSAGIEIHSVNDIAAAHGFPVQTAAVPCDQMISPFVNDCDYDAAGELLQTIYGELQPPSAEKGALQAIPQPGAAAAEMLDEALLYVPRACADGDSCGLHIVFHGCNQSTEFVGDAFAGSAGYLPWAESNHLLVLFPQVGSSKFAPMNPLGCWDWWGYTNEQYALRDGVQIAVVKATIDALAGQAL